MNEQDAIESLIRYRDQKIPTGGFLEACLSNDLKGAVGAADETSLQNLLPIIRFIVNDLPHGIQGNYEKVNRHLNGISTT